MVWNIKMDFSIGMIGLENLGIFLNLIKRVSSMVVKRMILAFFLMDRGSFIIVYKVMFISRSVVFFFVLKSCRMVVIVRKKKKGR